MNCVRDMVISSEILNISSYMLHNCYFFLHQSYNTTPGLGVCTILKLIYEKSFLEVQKVVYSFVVVF